MIVVIVKCVVGAGQKLLGTEEAPEATGGGGVGVGGAARIPASGEGGPG